MGTGKKLLRQFRNPITNAIMRRDITVTHYGTCVNWYNLQFYGVLATHSISRLLYCTLKRPSQRTHIEHLDKLEIHSSAVCAQITNASEFWLHSWWNRRSERNNRGVSRLAVCATDPIRKCLHSSSYLRQSRAPC